MEFVYSTKNPDAPVAFASFNAMHSVFEMVIAGVSGNMGRNVAGKVQEKVREIEGKLNRHDPDSVFSKLDSSSGLSPVGVDDEVFSILQFCETFRKSTAGYFDIAALSVSDTRPAYRLSPECRTVCLSGEGLVLDAGGFGKGYAIDVVRTILSEEGVGNALVNFGDSSVTALGRHPFGDCWQVQARAGGGSFMLKDSSLSVSGPRPDGSAHIVNPQDGSLVGNRCLVAVEGRSAFVCEALSTALYAAPEMMRPVIMSSFGGYSYKVIRQDFKQWIEENL